MSWWAWLRNRAIVFWLPILLILLFCASVVYSQAMPSVNFRCENGVCSAPEGEIERFQSFLNRLGVLVNELYEENEKLKKAKGCT